MWSGSSVGRGACSNSTPLYTLQNLLKLSILRTSKHTLSLESSILQHYILLPLLGRQSLIWIGTLIIPIFHIALMEQLTRIPALNILAKRVNSSFSHRSADFGLLLALMSTSAQKTRSQYTPRPPVWSREILRTSQRLERLYIPPSKLIS